MCLAETLGADFALVGETVEDCRRVSTVAVFGDGQEQENFIYELAGTPCENVLGADICAYRDQVCQQFPEDRMLQEMGIRSYVGAPLLDHENKPLGILVVLFRRPLEDAFIETQLLQIFAARAAAELARRQGELALAATNRRFRLVFQNALTGICTMGPDGRLLGANPRLYDLLGCPPASLQQAYIMDLLQPDDWQTVHREFFQLMTGELASLRREVRLVRLDGSSLWVDMAVTGSGLAGNGDNFCIGMFLDITQRRAAAEALRIDKIRSESLFRLSQMVQESPKELKDFALEESVRLTGSTIGYLYFLDETEQWLRLHAWSGTVMGECEIVDPQTEYRVTETGLWGEAVRQRRPILTNDYAAPNPWKRGLPEGHVPLQRHMNIPLLDEGRIVLVAGVGNKAEDYDQADVRHLTLLMDGLWRILKQRTAEDQLRSSEQQYRGLYQLFRALLAGIPDRITLLDPDRRVVWDNHRAEFADPGQQPAPGEQRRLCFELWHDNAEICQDCPPERAFASGRLEQGQIETPDGRIWDLRAIPILDEPGNVHHVIELAQDITDRIRAQAQTVRSAHLASLGELAAGVAHEINNPANGIINYAQILADRLGRESDLNDLARRIIREGEAIATIVRNLLDFARPHGEERRLVDLAEEVRESLALTAAQLRRARIECRLDIPEDLPSVRASSGQLRQVFLNIINNARYALDEKWPDGNPEKVLEIKAFTLDTDPPKVRLVFTDAGTGIPAELLERVTNPFVTTKPVGKGTGLGLSISHGIIANHGGSLKLESLEGHYTRVRIDLPVQRS